MKKIPYIVAIVIAVTSVILTLNLSGKFKKVQATRLETISERKQHAINAESTEKQLKETREAKTAAESKSDEATQKLDTLKAEGTSIEREIAAQETIIKSQNDELVEVQKKLDEVNRIMSDLGGGVTIDTLGDKVQEIENEKKARQAKVEELATLTTAAEKLLATNRAEADRLVKRDIERNSRFNAKSMESVISAINQDWGFLVIAAGSNSGFTPQTPLIVERDGKMLGRVRPSSVEPTQTIAEIDFDSLAAGVRLQPGDRVVLAKPYAN